MSQGAGEDKRRAKVEVTVLAHAPLDMRFPLHYAAQQGDIERVKYLLGVDDRRRGLKLRPDDEDDLGRTPLHVAAAFGHADICKLFVELDKSLVHNRAAGMQDMYPIHLACAGGWESDTFLSDSEFYSSLLGTMDRAWGMSAITSTTGPTGAEEDELTEGQKKRLAVVTLLLESDADATARSATGASALHLAAGTGDLECARKLLEFGADVNCSNAAGRTPLFSATSNGQREMILLLLNAGADGKVVDKFGEGVLHAAALCTVSTV